MCTENEYNNNQLSKEYDRTCDLNAEEISAVIDNIKDLMSFVPDYLIHKGIIKPCTEYNGYCARIYVNPDEEYGCLNFEICSGDVSKNMSTIHINEGLSYFNYDELKIFEAITKVDLAANRRGYHLKDESSYVLITEIEEYLTDKSMLSVLNLSGNENAEKTVIYTNNYNYKKQKELFDGDDRSLISYVNKYLENTSIIKQISIERNVNESYVVITTMNDIEVKSPLDGLENLKKDLTPEMFRNFITATAYSLRAIHLLKNK